MTTTETHAPPAIPEPRAGSPDTGADLHVRLTLMNPGHGAAQALDGAWWPRSRSLVSELPGVVLDLQRRGTTISRVGYRRESWEPAPRRLAVAGRTIRLGWFPGLDPHLVRLTGESGQVRLDLLVVPPDVDEAVAIGAMAAASGRPSRVGATPVLAAVGALPAGDAAVRTRTCPGCGSMPLPGGHCECGYADIDARNHPIRR